MDKFVLRDFSKITALELETNNPEYAHYLIDGFFSHNIGSQWRKFKNPYALYGWNIQQSETIDANFQLSDNTLTTPTSSIIFYSSGGDIEEAIFLDKRGNLIKINYALVAAAKKTTPDNTLDTIFNHLTTFKGDIIQCTSKNNFYYLSSGNFSNSWTSVSLPAGDTSRMAKEFLGNLFILTNSGGAVNQGKVYRYDRNYSQVGFITFSTESGGYSFSKLINFNNRNLVIVTRNPSRTFWVYFWDGDIFGGYKEVVTFPIQNLADVFEYNGGLFFLVALPRGLEIYQWAGGDNFRLVYRSDYITPRNPMVLSRFFTGHDYVKRFKDYIIIQGRNTNYPNNDYTSYLFVNLATGESFVLEEPMITSVLNRLTFEIFSRRLSGSWDELFALTTSYNSSLCLFQGINFQYLIDSTADADIRKLQPNYTRYISNWLKLSNVVKLVSIDFNFEKWTSGTTYYPNKDATLTIEYQDERKGLEINTFQYTWNWNNYKEPTLKIPLGIECTKFRVKYDCWGGSLTSNTNYGAIIDEIGINYERIQ
jgi:hypothetical protein